MPKPKKCIANYGVYTLLWVAPWAGNVLSSNAMRPRRRGEIFELHQGGVRPLCFVGLAIKPMPCVPCQADVAWEGRCFVRGFDVFPNEFPILTGGALDFDLAVNEVLHSELIR